METVNRQILGGILRLKPIQAAKAFLSSYSAQVKIFLIIFATNGIYNFLIPGTVGPTGGDEFGEIAAAAIFAGKNMADVLSKTIYYGIGYPILMSPLFLTGASFPVIHVLMLFYNTACLALSAVICYNILDRFLLRNNKTLTFILALTAALYFPIALHSNNVITESMLILLNWIYLYILFVMGKRAATGQENRVLSLVLSFAMAYGYLVHTRVIYMYGAIFVFLVTNYVITKRRLLTLRVFIPSSAVLLSLSGLAVKYYQSQIWGSAQDGEVLANSAESIPLKLIQILRNLTSVSELMGAMKCVMGQLYAVFCLSGGLIYLLFAALLIGLFGLINTGTREKMLRFINENIELVIGMSYALSQIIVIILLSSFAADENIKWLLYERYWGASAGIAIMLAVVFAYKVKDSGIFIRLSAVLAALVNIIFLYRFSPIFNGTTNNQSGVYYAYAGMAFMRYGDEWSFFRFLSISLFAGCVALLVYFFISKKRFKHALLVLLFFFFYNYSYVTVEIYGSISDNSSKAISNVQTFFERTGISERQHPQIYTSLGVGHLNDLQAWLYDFNVIPHGNDKFNFAGDIYVMADDTISISRDVKAVKFKGSNQKYCVLINAGNQELIKRIADAGYELYNINDVQYEADDLNYTNFSLTEDELALRKSEWEENPGVLNAPGDLQFGPYVYWYPGRYKISVIGENLDAGKYSSTLMMGNIEPVEVLNLDISDEMVTYEINLADRSGKIEFVTQNSTGETLIIDHILIERVNEMQYEADDLGYTNNSLTEEELSLRKSEWEKNPGVLNTPGDVQFGPYENLSPGRYKISVKGENLDAGNYSCTRREGAEPVEVLNLDISEETVTYEINLTEHSDSVEFLTQNSTEETLIIDHILLERIDA